METIVITLQERWAASRKRIHKNKKKYNRKDEQRKIRRINKEMGE